VPLAGADFPSGVFIKPDGQWVGFVGEFVLRKVAINGGAVQDLLKLGARSMLGATWGERGTIIFATERTSTGLEQISEDGGATTVLTRPNRDRGEDYHAWPAFLPGSQAVLFTILHAGSIDSAEIAVLDLSTGAHKVILRGGSAPRYLPSGHLVYGAAGSLRAVAFDLERLEVRGTPVPVVPQLLTTLLISTWLPTARSSTCAGAFRNRRGRWYGSIGRAGKSQFRRQSEPTCI
jgi:serine/threonine-protein kinase